MNCFNLIYMLKVLASTISSNDYLKLEEIIRDESAILHGEKLEKTIYRATGVRLRIF